MHSTVAPAVSLDRCPTTSAPSATVCEFCLKVEIFDYNITNAVTQPKTLLHDWNHVCLGTRIRFEFLLK